MRKKLLLIPLALLLAISLVAIGCPTPPPTTTAPTLAPYVIGVSPDLTGQAANIGIAEKRVYLMKTEEIIAAGGVNGRQLELIIYDAESDPAKAVLNTKKLIDVGKVIACTGYSSTGTTLACVETATTGKTVLFSLASSEKIWIPTEEWVFNTTPCQKDASTPILVDNLLQRGCTKMPTYIMIPHMDRQGRKPLIGPVSKRE